MSLRNQTLVNSLGSLVLLGSQWLISILLVRTSGYEDAGVFSLAMSIANVFLAFANFGMRNYQVTDIRNKFSPDQYILARVILSCFSVLLCLVYVLIDGFSPRSSIAILLYLAYNLFFNISDIMMGNLQLKNHLELNGYSNAMRGMSCFLLFLFVHLQTGNLLFSMAAMSLGALIVLLLFDIPKHRRFCGTIRLPVRTHIKTVLTLYSACFFAFVSTIMPIIITAVPRREIDKQLGDAMLGVFSSVYTPTVLLNTLIPTILLSFVPVITRLWQDGDIRSLRSMIAKSYGIVIAITLLALVLSCFTGKLFLRLVFGAEILPYSSLLYWAIAAIGLNCACICGNHILIAFRNGAQAALFSAIAMITAIITSNRFIRGYGIYGGAYVLIIAYITQILMQFGMIAYKMRLRAME